MHHLNEQHIQRQKCTLCSRLHYPLAQSANSQKHYTSSKTKPRLINAPRIQIAADKKSADCATNASFANSRVSKLMSKEEENQESYIIMPTSRRRRRRKNEERERRRVGEGMREQETDREGVRNANAPRRSGRRRGANISNKQQQQATPLQCTPSRRLLVCCMHSEMQGFPTGTDM